MLYDVPNIRMTSYLGSSFGGASASLRHRSMARAGAWANVFARESQSTSWPPRRGRSLEFRAHCVERRLIRVLKAAADALGWKAQAQVRRVRDVPSASLTPVRSAHWRRSRGRRKTGAIQVKRVVAAQDMGIVINRGRRCRWWAVSPWASATC